MGECNIFCNRFFLFNICSNDTPVLNNCKLRRPHWWHNSPSSINIHFNEYYFKDEEDITSKRYNRLSLKSHHTREGHEWRDAIKNGPQEKIHQLVCSFRGRSSAISYYPYVCALSILNYINSYFYNAIFTFYFIFFFFCQVNESKYYSNVSDNYWGSPVGSRIQGMRVLQKWKRETG